MKSITIKDLPNVSEQELFEFLSISLIKQSKPCIKKGICKYRNDEGNKCIAGFLVTDEEAKIFDNCILSGWDSLVDSGYIKENNHKYFISKLQNIHDHGKDEIDFNLYLIKEFKIFSIINNLDSSFLERIN